MAQHLTFLSAGREKRLYAVPPFTKVEPLVFSDVPFKVEDHGALTCHRSGVSGFYMNEIPQDNGGSAFELSDSRAGQLFDGLLDHNRQVLQDFLRACEKAEGEVVESLKAVARYQVSNLGLV